MNSKESARQRRQSGQAAVESALTLPLSVFLILGTLQLFLMLQGRLMAEHAAFRATRAGSVRHGDCEAMMDAALLAVLPSFDSFLGSGSGTPAQKLAGAFRARKDNNYKYVRGLDGEQGERGGGDILWIIRQSPRSGTFGSEAQLFDQPGGGLRLETRIVFWFPLKIPFADWVISRMLLASWGWGTYTADNPLMSPQTANWGKTQQVSLEDAIRDEMVMRVMTKKQYVVPIHASGSLRMMTPPRQIYFDQQNCNPAPQSLQ